MFQRTGSLHGPIQEEGHIKVAPEPLYGFLASVPVSFPFQLWVAEVNPELPGPSDLLFRKS